MNISLDIPTLVFILGVTHLIQVVVFIHQYRVNKTYPGVGWWLLWSVAEVFGFLFILLRDLQGVQPLVIILQNSLIVAGTLFLYIGVRLFLGRKVNVRMIIPVAGFFLSGLFFFLFFRPDFGLRSAVINGTLAFISLATAYSLFTDKIGSIRSSANFNAVIFLLHGLIFGYRTIVFLTGATDPDFLSPTIFNFIPFFDALIVSLIWTFGLIIMMNQRLHAEAAETREHLQELNREKDKMMSILAHDMRSPFHTFLGLTQILVEELYSMKFAEVKNIAENLNRSAVSLYKLLDDLLEWSYIQRGKLVIQPETIVLKEKVHQITELLTDYAQKKGLRISNDIPEDMVVFTDTHMFETIVRNLVFNAVKFTPEGGRVNISARLTHNNMTEISVSDTGIGIPNDMINKLFVIDQSTSRKGTTGEPSTGLGLVVCKEFVEKHGGEIRVESTEGIGSTFSFTIPSEKSLSTV